MENLEWKMLFLFSPGFQDRPHSEAFSPSIRVYANLELKLTGKSPRVFSAFCAPLRMDFDLFSRPMQLPFDLNSPGAPFGCGNLPGFGREAAADVVTISCPYDTHAAFLGNAAGCLVR